MTRSLREHRWYVQGTGGEHVSTPAESRSKAVRHELRTRRGRPSRLPTCSCSAATSSRWAPTAASCATGHLAVHEGKISWIGHASEASRPSRRAERSTPPGASCCPGLVDTHFHTGQQLLRGKITELARRRQLKLPIWRNYLIPFESVLTEEDMYLSAQIALREPAPGGHDVLHRRRRPAPR